MILSLSETRMTSHIAPLVTSYVVRFWPVAVVVASGGWLVFKGFMARRRQKVINVLITGAGGHIGYSLTTLIAKGAMFGPSTPVFLRLLDVKQVMVPLEGLRLELLDLASPLLTGVLVTSSIEEACQGVDVAIMLAGAPRKPGANREDTVASNVPIYKEQAAALEAGAAPNVKVVVVASPANTNAYVLYHHAPSIPAHNITCLSRLDHNRAVAQVAEKAGVQPDQVSGVVVWGNHSAAQFPDARHATVAGRPAGEVLGAPEWLTGELIARVQQRGQTIMQPVTSMGVMSDGSYNVPPGIFFSLPVRCGDGQWRIEQGLPVDDFARERLNRSAVELLEEKRMALKVVGPPHA